MILFDIKTTQSKLSLPYTFSATLSGLSSPIIWYCLLYTSDAADEEDSQPVTTIISLAFTELTPLYDEDYAEFTSDDDVGL